MRVAFLYNEPGEDPAGIAEDCVPERSPIVLALRQAGHEVTPVVCTLDLAAVRSELDCLRPDVVFNRVESLGGSDALAAALTLLLDVMHIPYTGCTTEAMLATANKVTVKQRLAKAGLPTPQWIQSSVEQEDAKSIENSLATCSLLPAPRYILKSTLEHASFAIDDESIVSAASREEAIAHIRRYESCWGRPYFAERFIDGREFNLALFGEGPTALPPAEIDFSAFPTGKPRIVSQVAKFDANSFEYENTPRRYDFPSADCSLVQRLVELAAECWRLFDLQGYARIDFRADADGQAWILEINSNPCLSPDSGFAAAASHAGMSYDDLIGQILLDAVARGRRKNIQPGESIDEHTFASA